MEAFLYTSILVLTSDPTNSDGKFKGKKGIFPQQKFSVLKNVCFKTYLEIILIEKKSLKCLNNS